ncbi:MAG: peptide chain release factor 1 [Candidatus Wildermuthbacteria bacterium]|nr:peptide chain release factor 1 [Candidatus Wildermuthbacteria bacterium]
MERLEDLQKEYDSLTERLTDPELISNWEKMQELSKRRGTLEKVIKKAEELKDLEAKIEENREILLAQEDPELSSLANAELLSLKAKEEELKKELDRMLLGKETEFPKAVIIEIRAGTGGEEAALFASSLLDMYTKYAAKRGWETTLLNIHESELKGIKEAELEIKGETAFQELRHEGGVHRVQRIPATEKAGRVHTSTASVAVLAKPERSQVHLNPADLTVDFYNSSGPGGQNVNKRKTAVRVTHIPSGLVVAVQESRNQLKNKEYAMALLEAKLLEQEREEKESAEAGQRKSQIGQAKRAEKIRTYNFPQDRITDHRVEKSWHNIEQIMEGNLESFFAELDDLVSQQETANPFQ